jgi:hypothetical protein
MTDDFANVITLAGLSVFNVDSIPKCTVGDWNHLMSLAIEQSVLPLVWHSLKKAKISPKDISAATEKEAQSAVLSYYLRKEMIINLLAQAEKENLRAYVLKGFAVAESYAVPDARISLDTDILIDKADEKAMLLFLERNGFIVYPREKGNHHTICMHPLLGTLELHIDFFSKDAHETWFHNIDLNEHIDWFGYKQISSLGEYWTIDPTSHMIFLFLHMLHHFVDTGASLRMFFDIAAFWYNNYKAIDIEKLLQVITECNGMKLLFVILGICEKYCGIDFKKTMDYTSDERLVHEVLDDLENGGFMGTKESRVRELERNENTRKKVLLDSGRFAYFILQIKRYGNRIHEYFFPRWCDLVIIDPLLSRKKYRLLTAWYSYVKHKFMKHNKRIAAIKKIPYVNKRSSLLYNMGILD